MFTFFFCLQALSSAAPEVAAAAHQALARCEVLLHPRAASNAAALQQLSATLADNVEQVSNAARCLAGGNSAWWVVKLHAGPQAVVDG